MDRFDLSGQRFPRRLEPARRLLHGAAARQERGQGRRGGEHGDPFHPSASRRTLNSLKMRLFARQGKTAAPNSKKAPDCSGASLKFRIALKQ